jgi:hypothetical protein
VNFIEMYAKELVALLVPIITWGLNRTFRARAKLLLGNPHRFTFLVQEPLLDANGKVISPNQSVQTASYMLRNAGAETAKNLELVFNWKPQCINIWPSRHTTEYLESDGRFVLVFENLAPGEVLGFELMAVNGDVPALITARSEQCVAVTINMLPQPVAEPWRVKVVVGLALAGLGLVAYLALLLLQFIVLKTPLR